MKNGLILETMLKSARRRTMDPGGAQSCSMTSCVSETRLIWHHAGTPFRVSLTVATTRTRGWSVRVRTGVAFRAFTCKGELDIRYFSGLSYESELDNRYFSALSCEVELDTRYFSDLFVWEHSILLGPLCEDEDICYFLGLFDRQGNIFITEYIMFEDNDKRYLFSESREYKFIYSNLVSLFISNDLK